MERNLNNPPQLFIFRNRNKVLVEQFMNNINYEPNDSSKDLANQDKLSLEQLRAMQLVAKMKEAADRVGAGFVGGFITPTGQRFMMSNVNQDDVQYQAIQNQLDSISNQNQNFFDSFQNSVRIIESEDGIQIQVEPES